MLSFWLIFLSVDAVIDTICFILISFVEICQENNEVTMDELTRLICTRGLQITMLIPLFFAIRQLYKDVYGNNSNTCQDEDKH